MLTRRIRGLLIITISCCAVAWFAALFSCLSYPSISAITVSTIYPNISRTSDATGSQDSIQFGLWSYCVHKHSDWNPCDNVAPCPVNTHRCSSPSFGYSLRLFSETQAFHLSTVSVAVFHVLTVISLSVHTLFRLLGFSNPCFSLLDIILIAVSCVLDGTFKLKVGRIAEKLFDSDSSASHAGFSFWLLLVALVAIACEHVLCCVEANCTCDLFAVHRAYDGESLVAYLRTDDPRNIAWRHSRAYLDARIPRRKRELKKTRSVGFVPARQECGFCWEAREKLFALPCDHLVCSNCVTPRLAIIQLSKLVGGSCPQCTDWTDGKEIAVGVACGRL